MNVVLALSLLVGFVTMGLAYIVWGMVESRIDRASTEGRRRSGPNGPDEGT